MTTQRLRAELRRMDPNVSLDSEDGQMALIMLAGLVTGPDPAAAGKLAGLDRGTARKLGAKLRRTRIWVGTEIHHGGWDGPDGGIAFWLDVAVACGLLVRR